MLPTAKLMQEARANWVYSDHSLGVFRDRYLDEMISDHIERILSLESSGGTVPARYLPSTSTLSTLVAQQDQARLWHVIFSLYLRHAW